MLVGVYTDTVSPHNLFYISLFDFGGTKTRVDRYNITKNYKIINSETHKIEEQIYLTVKE